MDENAKTQFKWKFYRLTVEINIIVLLVAMSIPIFLIIHSPYTVPVIIGMLAFALILSLDCIKKYRETKLWLDDNAEKGKELGKETE
jgi:predicted membrane chloride channel (bestrophin family)